MKEYEPYVYSEVVGYPWILARHIIKRFGMVGQESLLAISRGLGEYAKAFADWGMRVTGIDPADYKGEMDLLVKVGNGQFIFKERLGDDHDWVWTKSILEHSYCPEEILYRLRLALKPGGRIISMVPNYNRHFWESFTHRTPFRRSSLEMLHEMYFEDVTIEKHYCTPILWHWPGRLLLLPMRALSYIKPLRQRFTALPHSRGYFLIATGRKA